MLCSVSQQCVRAGQRCRLSAVMLTPVTVSSLIKQLKQKLQEGNLGKISFPMLYITRSPLLCKQQTVASSNASLLGNNLNGGQPCGPTSGNHTDRLHDSGKKIQLFRSDLLLS